MTQSLRTRRKEFSLAHPILSELIEAWIISVTLILLVCAAFSWLASGNPIAIFSYSWTTYAIGFAISIFAAVVNSLNADGSAY